MDMNTTIDLIKSIETALGRPADGFMDAADLTAVAVRLGVLPLPVPEPLTKLPSLLPWTAEIDGEDLVMRNVHATCWGGAHDAGDDGKTESGVLNDGSDPNLMGVALPIRSVEAATRNSPLAFSGPHIPWKTIVRVWRESEGEATAVECTLIDNGPNTLKFPTHAMDLTEACAAHFAPNVPRHLLANSWDSDGMSARIIGGAKWIS